MAKVKKKVRPEGQDAKLKKAKPKTKKAAANGSESNTVTSGAKDEKPPFSSVEVFTKPGQMQPLFSSFRDGEVACDLVRPRMLTESVEHGRGRGIIRDFSFRKFKDQPRAVFFITWPKGVAGGSFEPADRLLNPGEQLQLTYTVDLEGASKPVYFVGKSYFLRKSYYIAENPANPGKPWTGAREEAQEKLPKDVFVTGEDIIEVRVDSVTSMPNGPGSIRRDVLDRYLSNAQLYCIPGGGGWAQRSTQGNFFKNIRDPLDKYIVKEGVKHIERVTLDEFGNLGDVTVLIKDRLLADIEHDALRTMMIKKPNDHLREINTVVGFLLYFKMTEEVKESVMRTFNKKVGKEEEVYLPLMLERVADSKEQYRVTFRVFPRDLVEERSRNSMERGLQFMPPYTLHPGSENQNTFSKLLIALSQRFREDEKPEEEKLKSEKLVASVQNRIAEQQHKFTDDKIKSAFQDRVAAKKRKEDGG
jgi:hypothetical protein